MPTAGNHWRPTKGLTWQWQLDGRAIDTSVEAEVFDVDLFETPAETVRTLRDQGRRVICYFSAGSWEPYRPDSGDYPEDIMGGPVEGWEDERWLDIRRLDVLRPLIAARLDLCAQKGADAAEPDWMDSYAQGTGFDISADDQLAFNHMIADLAHERGLAIGLKNDLDQVAQLADTFDFAVVEQCAEFGECEKLRPFLDRGKPVFHAEYDLSPAEFCAESRRLGLSSIRKNLGLDPWRETC
ncbi:MAG TPA: endo alpha-1,4 polygalactosaminidase [Acidimicrobiales bacterium]|nr:endo alpha-1,4 polygalactosaminidase [Acidimicrobiales bacterium]